jgi:hypothetical protein
MRVFATPVRLGLLLRFFAQIFGPAVFNLYSVGAYILPWWNAGGVTLRYGLRPPDSAEIACGRLGLGDPKGLVMKASRLVCLLSFGFWLFANAVNAFAQSPCVSGTLQEYLDTPCIFTLGVHDYKITLTDWDPQSTIQPWQVTIVPSTQTKSFTVWAPVISRTSIESDVSFNFGSIPAPLAFDLKLLPGAAASGFGYVEGTLQAATVWKQSSASVLESDFAPPRGSGSWTLDLQALGEVNGYTGSAWLGRGVLLTFVP